MIEFDFILGFKWLVKNLGLTSGDFNLGNRGVSLRGLFWFNWCCMVRQGRQWGFGDSLECGLMMEFFEICRRSWFIIKRGGWNACCLYFLGLGFDSEGWLTMVKLYTGCGIILLYAKLVVSCLNS